MSQSLANIDVRLVFGPRKRMTVSLRCVADRLIMGHYTRVTKAGSPRVRRRPAKHLAQRCKRLEREVGHTRQERLS